MNDLPEGFQLDAPSAASGGNAGPAIPPGFQPDRPTAAGDATAAYDAARDRWLATVERAKSQQSEQPESTFLHPVKPPMKTWGDVGQRIMQYPGLVSGMVVDALKSGPELMRDVGLGRVDPMSPEGIGRARDVAMQTMLPTSVAAGTGAQIARRAAVLKQAPITTPGGWPAGTATWSSSIPTPNPDYVPPSPRLQAAQTAADIGAPLPAGLVSENPVVRATTQASRSLPLVGAKIDERVGQTINKAGETVGDIAENLAGGVPNRDIAGAQLRPSLEGAITANKKEIEQAYESLRNVIDADAVSPLPQTEATLKRILAERKAAGMKKPEAGLEDVINLANNGASFNGLQRQRNAVGEMTSGAGAKPEPHRGFIPADFDRIYGAMSADMERTVRANATAHPDVAANALSEANNIANTLIERNKNVQKLLNIQTDERRVGAVINMAQGKTGNARQLAELRAQLPKQDLDQIAGVALSDMGHNPATGQFSLEKFGTAFRKLGEAGKSWLFPDPAHRQALEGLARMDMVLKESDKYINKSGTARALMIGEGLTGAGTLGGAILAGNVPLVLGTLATGAGAYVLAKILARPATASALRKWATTAQTKQGIGTPARQAAIGLAGRNLMNNLRDVPEFIANTDAALRASDERASAAP